ncbi:hypothetical protein CV102_02465 [Natronococcus pandeyae]|uniref:Uncharacterized protein n=1 Tax=Natronococcus pandeyae TaxID=2055836 RepID=A0A8J8Q7C6_9EURY|nr:DUF5518 domain-containing protein [Natronococcus pandeyae]TYL40457.1 hypothetical protein CV102_02465 [Natronococcus pandeyae]
MESTPSEGVGWEGHPTADSPLPEFVDWILGVVVALAGLLSIVGWSALAFLVDRDVLAEGIEDGTVTVTVGTTELADAEALEVADAVVSWTGTGLLVTGLGMVLVAVGYVVVRHRAHGRAQAGEPVDSYGTYAVVGAVVTVVFSFVPFSPVLGGALAGYLERAESERTVSVGTLAGLLPFLPVLVILAFVLGGVVAGLLAVGLAGEAIVVGAALLFTLLLVVTIGAALGALGGYLGGRIAERRATTGETTSVREGDGVRRTDDE